MAGPFILRDEQTGKSLSQSPPSAESKLKELDLDEEPIQTADDTLTAYGMYQGLVKAWRNELFAPDVLSYKGDYVECMLEVVKAMEDSLRGSEVPEIVRSLHQLELERVRYVLSAYLRKRLEKIEKYADYNTVEDIDNLSGEERIFIREYIENMDRLFENVALRHMPPMVRNLDKDKAKVTPNLDEFVFIRANEDVGGVMIDDEAVNFDKNSIHILRYSEVKSVIEKGRVDLI
ncbi:DNA replication complex GINS protein SLD5 [Oopsacas minuta]|uniref:DNA replication complex GINS protein SLD5 n=1 Tax=Oopsacas minuta TaxID=111878 RepID=A0AAV7JYW2_9METZ|nr:DNA replication complex GINS protein SLD5 [Oopsacas minuta]